MTYNGGNDSEVSDDCDRDGGDDNGKGSDDGENSKDRDGDDDGRMTA